MGEEHADDAGSPTRVEGAARERGPASDSDWTLPTLDKSRRDLERTRVELEDTGVEVGATLARGGMAVVHHGQQRRLGRAVAVKTLEPGADGDYVRLLREARITGRLEHPNIVPVHDIFMDERGTPQVVLKLIEGDTWGALNRDAARVRESFGAEDLLTWNLEVLMGVCRALSFAHSRQVLHRDVKPSNIMVGPFGEVYLLDWGVALEMNVSELSSDSAFVEAVAGTMAYMAPEQLEADLTRLGPWTDTYLLGATLFHALAGRPPHRGKSPEDRCVELVEHTPPPPLPEGVPAELQRIVAAALEPEPSLRTRSPEDFRRALAEFLHHRSARRLVERADLERETGAAAMADDRDAEAARRLIAAEVAYRAALEEWPECAEAQRGIESLTVLRVEHALKSGEAKLAAKLVEGVESIDASLRARVEAACALAEREAARVRGIVSDSDRLVGHRVRGVLGAVLGVVFVLFWAGAAFFPPGDVTPLVAITVAFGAVGTLAVLTAGRAMLANRFNRTVLTVVGATLVAMVLWCVGGAALGLEVRTIQITLLLVWALAGASVAATVDVRGLPTSAAFALAFVAAAYEPSALPWAVVASGVAMVANHLVLNLFVTGRAASRDAAGAAPRSRNA